MHGSLMKASCKCFQNPQWCAFAWRHRPRHVLTHSFINFHRTDLAIYKLTKKRLQKDSERSTLRLFVQIEWCPLKNNHRNVMTRLTKAFSHKRKHKCASADGTSVPWSCDALFSSERARCACLSYERRWRTQKDTENNIKEELNCPMFHAVE